MKEQIQLYKNQEEFEKDSKWFFKNIALLRNRNLTNKFVAIKNENVIASDRNIEMVIKDLEKIGENPSYVLIEFVYPEETIILL